MPMLHLRVGPIHSPTSLTPWAQLYPPAEQVFAGAAHAQAQAAQHLLPLLSLDLAAFDPAWHGRVPVFGTVEPHDGTLGGTSQAFYNNWVSENWLAFRLGDDSRVTFLADWHYFERARSPSENQALTVEHRQLRSNFGDLARLGAPEPFARADAYTKHQAQHLHCAVKLAYFAKFKAQAVARQGLYPLVSAADRNRVFDDPQDTALYRQSLDAPGAWAYQVGGTCDWRLEEGPVNTADASDQYPVAPDGRRGHFIGAFASDSFGVSGGADVLVFFEPESRTVWHHHQWS